MNWKWTVSGLLARGFCSFSRRSPVNVLQTTHLIPDKVQGFSSAQLRPAEAHAVFLAEKVLLSVLGCCSLPEPPPLGQGWVQQLSRSCPVLVQAGASAPSPAGTFKKWSWSRDHEMFMGSGQGTKSCGHNRDQSFCPVRQQGLRLKTQQLSCSAANCSTKAKTKKKFTWQFQKTNKQTNANKATKNSKPQSFPMKNFDSDKTEKFAAFLPMSSLAPWLMCLNRVRLCSAFETTQ